MESNNAIPHLKSRVIEQKSLDLLERYSKDTGKKIQLPIPVLDMIEYLGYDNDFRPNNKSKDILKKTGVALLPGSEFGFSDKKMLDVLDLCLECKSCKSECPSNVDMAKIKYEFLNNYYKKNKIPIRSKLIGNIGNIYKYISGPQAKLFNIINSITISKYIL